MSRKALSVAFALVLLGALALMMPSAAIAAEESSSGEITAVDNDNASFTIKVGDESMTLKTNDDTSYAVNGQAAERGDTLVVGAKATVTHDEGVAKKIEVKKE